MCCKHRWAAASLWLGLDLEDRHVTYHMIVYRKGDIVMEPMNSRDVLPKNVPGVGWGWGGVDGGGVGHVGVGWAM